MKLLIVLLPSLLFAATGFRVSRRLKRMSTRTSMSTPDVSYMIGRTETREFFYITPEGLNIEFLKSSVGAAPPSPSMGQIISRFVSKTFRRPVKDVPKKRPPIFFIHGSFHSAWCFAENFFDYFFARGHTCYAISLRGTSNTGMPPNDPGETVRIEQHVSDVKFALNAIKQMEDNTGGAGDTSDSNSDATATSTAGGGGGGPIIVAHSFGGVVAMKLLEDEEVRRSLSGVCLMCSVPPSGNGPMTLRFIRSRFCAALKIVWGFVFKAATFDKKIAKELFFDDSVPMEDIERYMRNFRADSRVVLDIRSLAKVLPSKVSGTPQGIADWLLLLDDGGNSTATTTTVAAVASTAVNSNVTAASSSSSGSIGTTASPVTAVASTVAAGVPARLVIGAGKDYIVDEEGVKETGRFFNVEPIIVPGMYHDVMLGPRWRQTAEVISDWLDTLYGPSALSEGKPFTGEGATGSSSTPVKGDEKDVTTVPVVLPVVSPQQQQQQQQQQTQQTQSKNKQ